MRCRFGASAGRSCFRSAELGRPHQMCELGVGAMSVGRGRVAPASSRASASGTASVRLPLKPTYALAAVFLRAAGGRRFAFSWALAQVKANQGQQAADRRPPTTSPKRREPS